MFEHCKRLSSKSRLEPIVFASLRGFQFLAHQSWCSVWSCCLQLSALFSKETWFDLCGWVSLFHSSHQFGLGGNSDSSKCSFVGALLWHDSPTGQLPVSFAGSFSHEVLVVQIMCRIVYSVVVIHTAAKFRPHSCMGPKINFPALLTTQFRVP